MKNCRQCRYFYHSHKKGKPTLCMSRKSPRFPNKIHQDGHDNACRFFRPAKRPPFSVAINRTVPKPYKCVEQLHNVHKGKKIWIVGCGSSLDQFPDGYFHRDKQISIALKFSIARFPSCTYAMASYTDKVGVMSYIREHKLHSKLENFIITLKNYHPVDFHRFGKYQEDPYYMRVFRDVGGNYFEEAVTRTMQGKPCYYPGWTNIAHFAIYAATIMGAKKIYMAGCENREYSQQRHARKGGIEDAYLKYYPDYPKLEGLPEDFSFRTKDQKDIIGDDCYPARMGNIKLAKLFQKYKIEIVRYFYPSSEEKII